MARPTSDAHQATAPLGDLFLTRKGSLLGCLVVEGVDYDGLSKGLDAGLAGLAQAAVENMPAGASLTQYYVQTAGHVVEPHLTGDRWGDRLEASRARMLSQVGMSRGRLFYVFEFKSPEVASTSFMRDVLAGMIRAAFDQGARARVVARVKNPTGLLADYDALQRFVDTARDAMKNQAAAWSVLSPARVATEREFYGLLKYLQSFDPKHLEPEYQDAVPEDELEDAVVSAEIGEATYQEVRFLTAESERTRFARVLSAHRFPADPVGYLHDGPQAPLRHGGDMLVVNHFRPINDAERALAFKMARLDLERRSLNLSGMFKGEMSGDPNAGPYKFQRAAALLEAADAQPDRWGESSTSVFLIGMDKDEVLARSERVWAGLLQRGVRMVWEATALPMIYDAVQPGGAEAHPRRYRMMSSWWGTTGLHYCPNIGIPVEHFGPAAMVLETRGGHPFYLSMKVAKKGLWLGIGPTQSGKTYMLRSLQASMFKYRGLGRSFDLDAGAKMLARLFSEQEGGGYFEAGASALNPFVTCKGADDKAFAGHLNRLLRVMRGASDSEADRTLEPSEADDVADKIQAAMRMPRDMQNLRVLIESFQPSTRRKHGAWVGDGLYGGVFDGVQDAIGSDLNRVQAWNAQAYANSPEVWRALQTEFTWRNHTAIMDPRRRVVGRDGVARKAPMTVDIDEAHKALQDREYARWLIEAVRTWNKHEGVVSLWSQSVAEFMRLDDWDALKGSATGVIFLADRRMNEAQYREAFDLDSGSIEAIKSLVPRREAFIYQPEQRIAKIVRLRTTPLQHVINTSADDETAARDALIAEHGVERGVALAARAYAEGALV